MRKWCPLACIGSTLENKNDFHRSRHLDLPYCSGEEAQMVELVHILAFNFKKDSKKKTLRCRNIFQHDSIIENL